MTELKNEELFLIEGGSFLSAGKIASILSGIVFIIGFIDGYFRPLKCRR